MNFLLGREWGWWLHCPGEGVAIYNPTYVAWFSKQSYFTGSKAKAMVERRLSKQMYRPI